MIIVLIGVSGTGKSTIRISAKAGKSQEENSVASKLRPTA